MHKALQPTIRDLRVHLVVSGVVCGADLPANGKLRLDADPAAATCAACLARAAAVGGDVVPLRRESATFPQVTRTVMPEQRSA